MQVRPDGPGVCVPTPWMRVIVLVVIVSAVIVLVWCGYEAKIALGVIATAVPLVEGICRFQGAPPGAR